MSPEERMKRFDAAMVHAREAYSHLNMAFSQANKNMHLLQAFSHMNDAYEALGTELVKETIAENAPGPKKAAIKPSMIRKVDGNVVHVDFLLTGS